MNKWITSGACAVALAISGFAFAAAETKTVEGELVDLDCYAKQEATGEGHKGCAEKCLSSGNPAGVMADGKLYTIATNAKPLAEYASQTVRVTGKVSGDSMVIAPDKVEVKDGDNWKAVDLKGKHAE